jgi:diguanylate cyclase (GGDEF)-like protein
MMTDDQDGNSKMVVSFRDVTESRKAQEQIMYLAYHDVLTGLPNRLSFNEKLNEALLRAGRNHHKLALLLFDLDRFKLINDSYGHQMGDQLLVQVANRLREHFEQDVSIFRFGGDEFLVLLPFISNAKEAAEAGQQIISLIQPAFTIDRYVFHMSCSIGISLYPDYGNDMTTLIKHADIAMYRAKTKGKNSWELFQDEMAAYTMEQLHLESGLRKALEQQEFELYYQPQVEVDSGRLLGVEALIRWNCPDRGIVSPGVFIPLAEETGLIHPIGSWVLREACGQIKAWQDAGKAPIKCSINISGKQFEQSGFFEQLTWILNETGADPGALCFEITETVAIHNIDYCIELFGELQELGISISLDDFGTGFSSIALLKKLPFQYVKIDPAFIRNILTAPSDSAIVQGIIMLAHSLGMKVVAEGVEEEGQLELLRQFGCDYFQGYYYCKPLPASQFEDSLERQN